MHRGRLLLQLQQHRLTICNGLQRADAPAPARFGASSALPQLVGQAATQQLNDGAQALASLFQIVLRHLLVILQSREHNLSHLLCLTHVGLHHDALPLAAAWRCAQDSKCG